MNNLASSNSLKNLHKMRKFLPFYLSLIGMLLSSLSLSAADFTIKGKVSLITEGVPLPFYEVSIADGEGKYKATVSTSFSGKYNYTFDIPDGENVQFEVSVIDQCSGNPLIVGFEKEGNKEEVNFIVCDQNLNGAEEEDNTDDNEDNEDDNKDEEEYEEGGLPDFINCEALGLDVPVCTEDADGNTIEYASACAALAAGIKLQALEFCDGLPTGGIGNSLDFNCDQLGVDLPINVCVKNAEGENLNIPLCTALDEGYPLSQIEFCEGGDLSDLGSLLDLDSLDCDELGINLPVCGTDANGTEITFDTPCDALDAGLGINDLSICNGISGIGDALGFDCEDLANDLPFTVCIINAAGASEEVQLCDALNGGLSFDQLVLCDDGMSLLDSIDCDELGANIPVCSVDADGNSITFETPCAALDAGIALNELTICDDFIGNGIENLDCESLGLDVDIPVCTLNETGEQVELMLCEAITQGMDLENIELCEGALDDIDCSGLPVDLPVCATDADGNELNFDNPCDALAAGLGLNEITFCDGLVDGILNDLDCESLGLEVDIPVCTVNEAGEQVELMLCEALTQGISLDNVELCEGALDGIDCEGLGVNIPVCATDADGNELNFDNPCDALATGLGLNELTFCEGFVADIINDLDCEAIGFEIPVPVCVTNSISEQEELNLCDALSQGISPENIEVCANTFGGLAVDSEDCEGIGLNIPVCVTDADGNIVKYNNPCAALDAGYNIEDFGFCDNLLEDVMAAAFNSTPTEEEEVIIERADLFPNPAHKTITLNLKFAESSEFEVSIQSINGNAIYRQKYHTKNGDNMTDLDVSSLSAGIYVVKVATG